MTTIERPIQIQGMSRISAAAALRVYNFLNTRRTRRLNDLGLATGGSERRSLSLELQTPETQSPTKNVGPANLPHCCSSCRHVTVT